MHNIFTSLFCPVPSIHSIYPFHDNLITMKLMKIYLISLEEMIAVIFTHRHINPSL